MTKCHCSNSPDVHLDDNGDGYCLLVKLSFPKPVYVILNLPQVIQLLLEWPKMCFKSQLPHIAQEELIAFKLLSRFLPN